MYSVLVALFYLTSLCKYMYVILLNLCELKYCHFSVFSLSSGIHYPTNAHARSPILTHCQPVIHRVKYMYGNATKHTCMTIKGHVNVQSFVLSVFSTINQSACSTLDWVLNSKSDFDCVLYKNHWEFPVQKKIIPVLTCPIDLVATSNLECMISCYVIMYYLFWLI